MRKNMIHDENFVLLVRSEIHCEFFFFLHFVILSRSKKKKKKKLDKNVEVNYETCLKWISEFFLLYILRSYNDFSEKFQKFVTNFSTIFERVKFFF